MTKEQLKTIAEKYVSRSAWSTQDPRSYDQAIMGLSDAEFREITAHMHDQNGKILKGDPLDSQIVGWRRTVSTLKKQATENPSPELDARIAKLESQIEQAALC